MRLLFTGAAPWVNSGYGKPGRYLFPRLAALGHYIALCPFYGYRGATKVINIGGANVRMFPMARSAWFNDVISYHAASFQADLVISLQDVWLLEDWGQKPMQWLPRIPIDTDPVSHNVLNAIEGCFKPLALSKFGQKQLQDHGWPNAGYIPCGVDTKLYRPMPKAEARAAAELPQDAFIVGMVAANSSSPSRKSFPEVLQAWKRWRDGGGGGVLYLHTTIVPKREYGMQFQQLLETLGLDWSTLDDPDEARRARASVLFPSQHKMWCQAYDDTDLMHIYNSLDGLLSPSMAEGFGIPIVEAQACGVPVITLAVTSMPELTAAGVCLEPVQPAWEDQGGWRGVAPVSGILENIDWLQRMSGGAKARQYLAEKGRAFAEGYDFDRVIADYWTPLLESVGECS